MSHMEAGRLQECFGNIMPGTDNLSSSSFLLLHCFCCHTHLKLFTPLPQQAGVSPPRSSSSMGQEGFGKRHLRLVVTWWCFVEPVLSSGRLRRVCSVKELSPSDGKGSGFAALVGTRKMN